MKINENTKVTLTVGQLKKLVRESYEHFDPKADYCENCNDYFSGEFNNGVNTLWSWLYQFNPSWSRNKDDWTSLHERFNNLDLSDEDNDELEAELDNDLNDYCEYCALDLLNNLTEKYEQLHKQ